MVFVVIEDDYATADGEPLLRVDQHDDAAMKTPTHAPLSIEDIAVGTSCRPW